MLFTKKNVAQILNVMAMLSLTTACSTDHSFSGPSAETEANSNGSPETTQLQPEVEPQPEEPRVMHASLGSVERKGLPPQERVEFELKQGEIPDPVPYFKAKENKAYGIVTKPAITGMKLGEVQAPDLRVPFNPVSNTIRGADSKPAITGMKLGEVQAPDMRVPFVAKNNTIRGSDILPAITGMKNNTTVKAPELPKPVVPPRQVVSFDASKGVPTTQYVPSSVDVLVVMDNSKSMADNQDKSVDDLVHTLVEKHIKQKNVENDIDVQFGRVTTDGFLATSADPKAAQLIAGVADGTFPRVDVDPATGKSALRTGKPVLSTKMPSGYTGSHDEWIAELSRDLEINMRPNLKKPGTKEFTKDGHHEERAMESIYRFVELNEKHTSSKAQQLFRKGSTRLILVVSDEFDSTRFPGAPKGLPVYHPSVARHNGEYLKNHLDKFFMSLDGTTENPNYFVVTISNKRDAEGKVEGYDCNALDRLDLDRPITASAIDALHLADNLKVSASEKVQVIKNRLNWCHASTAYDVLVDVVREDKSNKAAYASFTADTKTPKYDAIFNDIGLFVEKQVTEIKYAKVIDLPADKAGQTITSVTVTLKDTNGNDDPSTERSLVLKKDYDIKGNKLRIITDLQGIANISKINVIYN